MSNRFAMAAESTGKSKKGKKKDELRNVLHSGDPVPLLNQRVVEGPVKGFRDVSTKSNARPKGKPRAQPTVTQDEYTTYASFIAASSNSAPAKKAPPKKVIGGDVITEAQLKAEKKAIEQQKKAVASQRVRVATGDAVTAKTKRNNEAKLIELADLEKKEATKKANAKKAVVVKGGSKQAPESDSDEEYYWTAPSKGNASKHADPYEAPAKKPAAKKAKAPAQRVVAKAPSQAPAAKSGGGKKRGGGLSVVEAAEVQNATDHTTLSDGSKVAMVRFCFIVNKKTIQVGNKEGTDVEPRAVAAVANALRATGTVTGGLFVVVEGKHFSDANTIDEPWMVESYFKALIPIANGSKPAGVAYPFWPQVQGKKSDDAEAEVKLSRHSDTALDLEHNDQGQSVRVSLKKARVSIAHFARDLVREGTLLCKAVEEIKKEVTAGSNPVSKESLAVLPSRLPDLVDELMAASAELKEAPPVEADE